MKDLHTQFKILEDKIEKIAKELELIREELRSYKNKSSYTSFMSDYAGNFEYNGHYSHYHCDY